MESLGAVSTAVVQYCCVPVNLRGNVGVRKFYWRASSTEMHQCAQTCVLHVCVRRSWRQWSRWGFASLIRSVA
jgi:hypothetical protein